jgi:hypothetical protein
VGDSDHYPPPPPFYLGRRGVESPLLGLGLASIFLIAPLIFVISMVVFNFCAHAKAKLYYTFPWRNLPSIGLALLISWLIIFLISISVGLRTYNRTWPKNGCYLAICTRFNGDDFGTAKTSLSPDDLRHLWQGGVDAMHSAVVLAVVAILNVIITLFVQTLVRNANFGASGAPSAAVLLDDDVRGAESPSDDHIVFRVIPSTRNTPSKVSSI